MSNETIISGTSLYCEDAINGSINSLIIDGNSYQETRSGKNLYNSATITSVSNGTNNNGVITSNTFSTNNLNLAPYNIVDLEVGTYYFSADIRIISGTPTFNKLNDYIADAEVVSKPTLSTTKQRYVYKKTYTSATHLTRMLFQFSASANAVVEVSNIMISKENTSYEQYGASPSPDFPSEIKNVEGIRNLFDLGTSLDDYFLTLIDGTKINTSLKVSDYVTATFTKNGISISNYNNSVYPWLSKIITLEKNTDYIISGSVSNGVKILGFPSLENGTIGTQISYIDNANVKPPKTFNSGNYAYYVISMYPPTNAYFEELQIEPGSIAHSYVPYGSWLKVQTTGKNLLNLKDFTFTSGGITHTISNQTINSVGTATTTSSDIGNASNLFELSSILASGTQLTFSRTNTSYRLFIKMYDENKGNAQQYEIPNGQTSVTFTLTGNKKYFYIFYAGWTSGTSVNNTINVQLEKGTTATDYEPYKENISLIDLKDNELCSIGDVKDQLIISEDGTTKIEKKIGKVVLDGNEALTQNSGKTCYYYNSSMFPLYDDKNKILSNYFKGATFNELYNATTDYGVSLNSSTNRLTIRHKDITDLTQFKTWLSTHNTEVYYILAEPYTIDLGQVDISLFENINHINLLDDIETNMILAYKNSNYIKSCMRYILDSQNYISNISFGAKIECNNNLCTPYVGLVPNGYESLCNWFDSVSENNSLNAWKIVNGKITYDPDKYNQIIQQAEIETEANTDATHEWVRDLLNNELNYKDGDTYELTSFVGGGYVTGGGTGFNLGTLFTPKSLANISSVTLNAGGKVTVRQGGNYLVGSATGGAGMSLTYCYAQKIGDNAIGIYYNAPSAPSGVTNNDAIGVVMSDLSITMNE